jgi:hypothetical protein
MLDGEDGRFGEPSPESRCRCDYGSTDPEEEATGAVGEPPGGKAASAPVGEETT